jgi:hypothetical protein
VNAVLQLASIMVEGRPHAHVTVVCGVTGDWLRLETPQLVGVIPPLQQLSSSRIHPCLRMAGCSCLTAVANR